MRQGRSSERRGAALLMVLGTLVLLAGAAASLARVATTVGARQALDVRTSTADDLARQAQSAALEWLDEESTLVVLPATAETPEVQVARDAWTWDGVEVEVTLTAWDQAGLVPYGSARAGSPLRATIPEDVRRVLDRGAAATPVGLDQFEQASGTPSPYPRARGGRTIAFGPSNEDPTAEPVPLASAERAVGAYVATHNRSPEIVNVNTAPLAVVEAALRLRGLGGIEAIESARAKGEVSNVAPPAPPRRGQRGPVGPTLVSRSESWAFRVDVKVGRVARSWWLVFEYSDSWTLVQRLAIPG